MNYNGPYLPEFDETQCVHCQKCVKACPVGALRFDENGHHVIDLDKCLGCGICESNCPKHIGKMVYTESRVQKVTEPSRLRVWLSVLYVKLIFTPGVWFYKTFKGSMMHLMQSDPREADIISTKQPGYIHGGEQYAERQSRAINS